MNAANFPAPKAKPEPADAGPTMRLERAVTMSSIPAMARFAESRVADIFLNVTITITTTINNVEIMAMSLITAMISAVSFKKIPLFSYDFIVARHHQPRNQRTVRYERFFNNAQNIGKTQANQLPASESCFQEHLNLELY